MLRHKPPEDLIIENSKGEKLMKKYLGLINPWLVEGLMDAIAELCYDDEVAALYSYVDPGNEEHYRAIIREFFVKDFASYSDVKKERTKLALRYYLSKKDVDFSGFFNACMPPFDPPNDPRDFFLWIWEEIYGDECYELADLNKYKVVPDIYEPNKP